MELFNIVNKICGFLPDGYQVELCMENGAAWVELYNENYSRIDLPDSGGQNLESQLNDALCVANGWDVE